MQWSPDPYALDLAEQTGFVITDVIRDLPEEPQKKSKHRLLAQKLYLLELLRDFCFGPGSPNFLARSSHKLLRNSSRAGPLS